MQLNIEKQKILNVTKRKKYNDTIINYHIADYQLSTTELEQDLGIVLKNNLKYYFHINAKSIREHNQSYISENSTNSFGRNFFINRIIPICNNFPFDVERLRTVTNFQENFDEFCKSYNC